MELAKLCRKAENEYVGVNCGLMDQFACAFGVAGHALALDTRSLAWQTLPLPKDVAIVIADSASDAAWLPPPTTACARIARKLLSDCEPGAAA